METIKKKCKVVILPTKEKSNILKIDDLVYFSKEGDKRYKSRSNGENHRGGVFNYIYIFSDLPLVEGDIGYNINTNSINSINSPSIAGNLGYKKIISSDDPSLKLPEPSLSFINKFCDSNGTITEIMVDFAKPHYPYDSTTLNPVIKWEVGKEKVIISKVKNSWNREEIDILLYAVMNLGMDLRQSQLNGTNTRSGNLVLKEWKEKNLI